MRRLLAIFLILASASPALAKVSANVLSRLPNYHLLELLEAHYCAAPTIRLIRPQAHADLRDTLLLDEKALQRCTAPEWLLREREVLLRAAIQNDAYLALLVNYRDNVRLLGTDAGVTPMFPLREGREAFSGVNLYSELMLNAEVSREVGLAVSLTPGFLTALDDFQYLNGRFYIQEGYIKLGYHRAEFTFGRQSLRFGDARHGNLALSGASKPLDVIKIAVRPHELPSVFSLLGPFTFETWFSDGGETNFVTNVKLWGLELGVRPFPWWEIGLMELYEYGGVGVPGLTFSDHLTMLYYSGADSLRPKRRRAGGIAMNFWAPNRFAKLYTQFFFDKFGRVGNWFNEDISVLAGLWLPKLEGMDVRLEYVHTVPGAYSSSIYPQGLTRERTPLGSPLGSDGEGAYVDFQFPPQQNWRPGLGVFYEARAKNPPPGVSTERRYGVGLAAQRRWTRAELDIEAKYARVTHHLYQHGVSKELFALLGTFRYSFF